MERDPSIHITFSNLVKLLYKLDVLRPEDFAHNIFIKAQPYQIKNRQHITTTAPTKRKINKTQESSDTDVQLFQSTIVAIRQEGGQKLIKVIKPGEREYAQLKETADLAIQFCDAYELNRREGFEAFIKIGLQLMGKTYGLNKFKYHFEKIGTAYESLLAIDQDPNPKSTDLVQTAYTKLCTSSGYTPEIKGEDRAHILYARLEADVVKANYNDWVKAQFAGLEWCNAIPELYQLYGEGAKKRYAQWRRDNNLKVATEVHEQTDEMTEYFNALKCKREQTQVE